MPGSEGGSDRATRSADPFLRKLALPGSRSRATMYVLPTLATSLVPGSSVASPIESKGWSTVSLDLTGVASGQHLYDVNLADGSGHVVNVVIVE